MRVELFARLGWLGGGWRDGGMWVEVGKVGIEGQSWCLPFAPSFCLLVGSGGKFG